MGRKEQIVLVVAPGTRARLDALRPIIGDSRARVTELALDIETLEAQHAGELKRLDELAKAAGVTRGQYAEAYAKAFSRHPYGAGLAELEQDDSVVRQHL